MWLECIRNILHRAAYDEHLVAQQAAGGDAALLRIDHRSHHRQQSLQSVPLGALSYDSFSAYLGIGAVFVRVGFFEYVFQARKSDCFGHSFDEFFQYRTHVADRLWVALIDVFEHLDSVVEFHE